MNTMTTKEKMMSIMSLLGDYTIVRQCQCQFTLEGDSKGFEGVLGFPDEVDSFTFSFCARAITVAKSRRMTLVMVVSCS